MDAYTADPSIPGYVHLSRHSNRQSVDAYFECDGQPPCTRCVYLRLECSLEDGSVESRTHDDMSQTDDHEDFTQSPRNAESVSPLMDTESNDGLVSMNQPVTSSLPTHQNTSELSHALTMVSDESTSTVSRSNICLNKIYYKRIFQLTVALSPRSSMAVRILSRTWSVKSVRVSHIL